ncbi:uncharacterized protein KZ484_003107 [Pholidichthys leucotaenia]
MRFINLIVGIPANLFVIAFLIHNRKDSRTSDVFRGYLAVVDVSFGTIAPFSLLNRYIWQKKEVRSVLNFQFGMKDASSPLLLSFICLDYYMAVLFPITFRQLKHFKYRLVLLMVVLCFSSAYSVARAINQNTEVIFNTEIVAAFTWMVVCNVSILWALKKSHSAGKDEMHPKKKKAFKTVLSILCITVFHYLPPVVLLPLKPHFSLVFKCYVHYIAFGFLNLSSTVQPFVYLSRLEKIPFLSDKYIPKLSGGFTPNNNRQNLTL